MSEGGWWIKRTTVGCIGMLALTANAYPHESTVSHALLRASGT